LFQEAPAARQSPMVVKVLRSRKEPAAYVVPSAYVRAAFRYPAMPLE